MYYLLNKHDITCVYVHSIVNCITMSMCYAFYLINNAMILSKTVLVRKACEMYMNNSETMYCTWAF